MVYGLCRTLPGDRAFLSPSSLRSLLLKNLPPASRRQDHTILPSARSALSSLALLASIASRSNVRDDRETPLSVGRDGGRYKLICFFGKSEYFCKWGWTGHSLICPTGALAARATAIARRADQPGSTRRGSDSTPRPVPTTSGLRRPASIFAAPSAPAEDGLPPRKHPPHTQFCS